ncbi:MAG: Tat pathway signal protein, partial [Atopobiaceae bacterium]|nr:Tat pathway signal protein [Atopobiaceae bacterium]
MTRETNISRRGMLKATAAAGLTLVTLDALAGCANDSSNEVSDPVVVDSDSATSVLEGYVEVDNHLEATHTWILPLGSVLHPAEGTLRPVIGFGDTSGQMCKASVFNIDTGELTDLVIQPLTTEANWVVFDARCSDTAFAWVELNMLTRDWRLYAQRLKGVAFEGTPALLWEGDRDFDPPTMACTGDRVIWQVMPSLLGTRTTEHSFCYLWKLGSEKATAVVESPGRFAIAPTVSSGTVTLAPRVRPEEGQFYGITAYDLADDMKTVVDQLVLPKSVRPFRASRLGDEFVFSIEANYGSGGLLGNMGTYVGTGDGPFISVPLEPVAGACGTTKGTLVVKVRASYFVIDINELRFSVLLAQDRSL